MLLLKVRIRVIRVLFLGLMGARVAEVFGLHRNSVSKAKCVTNEQRTFAALLLPIIPRDRMQLKMPLLNDYFKMLKTKSGTDDLFDEYSHTLCRTTKSFFGTPRKCFEDYTSFCESKQPLPSDDEIVKSARVFHRERKANNIGCEQGFVCTFHLLSDC